MNKNYKIEISLIDEETDSHVMTCSYIDDIKKYEQFGVDGLNVMFKESLKLMAELQAPKMLPDEEIDLTQIKLLCNDLMYSTMNKISLGLDLYPEFFQTEIIKALYGEKGIKWFEENKLKV